MRSQMDSLMAAAGASFDEDSDEDSSSDEDISSDEEF